jgi:hypothetical protein
MGRHVGVDPHGGPDPFLFSDPFRVPGSTGRPIIPGTSSSNRPFGWPGGSILRFSPFPAFGAKTPPGRAGA